MDTLADHSQMILVFQPVGVFFGLPVIWAT